MADVPLNQFLKINTKGISHSIHEKKHLPGRKNSQSKCLSRITIRREILSAD